MATNTFQNLATAATARPYNSNPTATPAYNGGAAAVSQSVDAPQSTQILNYHTENLKYFLELHVRDYSRASVMTVAKGQTRGVVVLPLPINLVNPMTIDYQEEASSALAQLSGMGNYTSGQEGNTSIQGETSGVGAIQAATLLGSPGLQAMTGYSPNQFMVVLLKGPKYKVFEMSWKLSPKNATESENLRQIIKFLNRSMSPGLEFGQTLFSFPKVFNLRFVPNHEKLYRFKPAVLQNFVVNYAGGGMPMFFGESQAPESVELRMTFMEIEYWLNADFVDESNAFAGRGENVTVTGNYAQDLIDAFKPSEPTTDQNPTNPAVPEEGPGAGQLGGVWGF